MQIPEPQHYGLIDRVVHEGEPELLLAPLSKPPEDVPSSWGTILTERDFRGAVARLWQPMEDRLPRVCRALQERLRGVGLLRTEEFPASLIYFFGDGQRLFEYRGRLPLADKQLARARLPVNFLDFYRIHNGWVLYYSEDFGPAPSGEWGSLSERWPDISWNLPPGDISPLQSQLVFRDGTDQAFAFDSSSSPPLALVYRATGAVDLLLDVWAAIDQITGPFLEDLDRTAQVTRTQQASALRNEQLLQHLPGHPAAAHRGGRYIHKQAYDLFLARAATDRKSGGTSKESLAQLRRALDEWCLSVEAGAETDASEMTDMFSLAHALSDTAAAEFVASIPPEIWFDESLVATEARVLLNLFHGKIDLAALDLDLLAGLCFEGDDPPDPQAEIRFRLLEALCQRNPSAFSKWRQTATEKLAVAAGTRLPLEIWLAGFDAVAMRLGVAGQAPSLKRS